MSTSELAPKRRARNCEPRTTPATEVIWLQVIPGRPGDACPWDDTWLLAYAHRAKKLANLLQRLPDLHVLHDGDDGATVIFPVDRLAEVVASLGPRRRQRRTA